MYTYIHTCTPTGNMAVLEQSGLIDAIIKMARDASLREKCESEHMHACMYACMYMCMHACMRVYCQVGEGCLFGRQM
jgi:hypothetical protein